MRNLFFLIVIVGISFTSCRSKHLHKIDANKITITDSLSTDLAVETYIKPYRIQINKSLDSVLCVAKETYSKKDGQFNTAIGNMMADAVFEQANPVFQSRTGNTIDIVLLNHGGIRSIISKGKITTRTAFEVMPFENSVVVVKMSGKKVKELIEYLVLEQKAHPIHGMQLIVDTTMKLKSATINGNVLNESESYFVATSDYLYNGGDRMVFFQPNEGLYKVDYKIRNILIDYFTKKDTLAPKIDDRFIQIKP